MIYYPSPDNSLCFNYLYGDKALGAGANKQVVLFVQFLHRGD